MQVASHCPDVAHVEVGGVEVMPAARVSLRAVVEAHTRHRRVTGVDALLHGRLGVGDEGSAALGVDVLEHAVRTLACAHDWLWGVGCGGDCRRGGRRF